MPHNACAFYHVHAFIHALAETSLSIHFTVHTSFYHSQVHHQLAQLRDALALAQALGRILILPKLICGLDR